MLIFYHLNVKLEKTMHELRRKRFLRPKGKGERIILNALHYILLCTVPQVKVFYMGTSIQNSIILK